MHNILSVDVEDWFHILELDSVPDVKSWGRMESRVEKNFFILLDEFDDAEVKVTCFFLGWVAEKFPNLVKEAHKRGHEIASHGYAHQLVYTQSRDEFSSDIKKTKDILEDIIGNSVEGYRSPGFSFTQDTPWVFEQLCAEGYSYDSSIFPASRGHGGISGANMYPHKISTVHGTLIEFPITVTPIMQKRLCFFGGGYLRLFPYFVIRHMTGVVNKDGRPVIYYIHPREIDPTHPRLQMGWKRRFKSYINLRTTMPKLQKLLHEQNVLSFRDWLMAYSHELSTANNARLIQ